VPGPRPPCRSVARWTHRAWPAAKLSQAPSGPGGGRHSPSAGRAGRSTGTRGDSYPYGVYEAATGHEIVLSAAERLDPRMPVPMPPGRADHLAILIT
jgi:hypothetical protein